MEKFLEHTKLELFHDQVFCFTPKGRLIALPARRDRDRLRLCGSHRRRDWAVGCKINGRIAPLISELHNGDEVLISRAEGGSPPAAWDSVVVTDARGPRSAARPARRRKRNSAASGRQIVERAFGRAGKKFTEAKLKAALPRLARASIDDVFIGVGRGEIFSTDVVRAVFPNFKEERKAGPAVPQNESGWFGLPKAADSCSACRASRGRAACRCAASTSIRR